MKKSKRVSLWFRRRPSEPLSINVNDIIAWFYENKQNKLAKELTKRANGASVLIEKQIKSDEEKISKISEPLEEIKPPNEKEKWWQRFFPPNTR